MPETTPLIKAALNLRVGAGFDVYVFPVSGTVRRMISQHLIVRAYIAVKIFIIHILGFFEKTILGHGAFIRQKRCDAIIQK